MKKRTEKRERESRSQSVLPWIYLSFTSASWSTFHLPLMKAVPISLIARVIQQLQYPIIFQNLTFEFLRYRYTHFHSNTNHAQPNANQGIALQL